MTNEDGSNRATDVWASFPSSRKISASPLESQNSRNDMRQHPARRADVCVGSHAEIVFFFLSSPPAWSRTASSMYLVSLAQHVFHRCWPRAEAPSSHARRERYTCRPRGASSSTLHKHTHTHIHTPAESRLESSSSMRRLSAAQMTRGENVSFQTSVCILCTGWRTGTRAYISIVRSSPRRECAREGILFFACD